MSETPQPRKTEITPDWFVQGILTRLGDTFDRLLGRGWKPSSSLATSELIERLKSLMDAESRENESKARFVPHRFTLKMQWDKFSTDAEDTLAKLEYELLAAAVDHINDRRYYTHAPLSIEIKPDYFTSGVKLYASFDDDRTEAEAEVDVSPVSSPAAAAVDEVKSDSWHVVFSFTDRTGRVKRVRQMAEGTRLSVGRTKENDIFIDDDSVSKLHASLVRSQSGGLLVADTGSTNGTFINGDRIAYGKAVEVGETEKLTFGSVEVSIQFSETSAGTPEDREI